jgi:hypothetical protein
MLTLNLAQTGQDRGGERVNSTTYSVQHFLKQWKTKQSPKANSLVQVTVCCSVVLLNSCQLAFSTNNRQHLPNFTCKHGITHGMFGPLQQILHAAQDYPSGFNLFQLVPPHLQAPHRRLCLSHTGGLLPFQVSLAPLQVRLSGQHGSLTLLHSRHAHRIKYLPASTKPVTEGKLQRAREAPGNAVQRRTNTCQDVGVLRTYCVAAYS